MADRGGTAVAGRDRSRSHCGATDADAEQTSARRPAMDALQRTSVRLRDASMRRLVRAAWLLLLLLLLLALRSALPPAVPRRPASRCPSTYASDDAHTHCPSHIDSSSGSAFLAATLYAASSALASLPLLPLGVGADTTTVGDGVEPQLFPPVLFLDEGITAVQTIQFRIEKTPDNALTFLLTVEGSPVTQGTVSPPAIAVDGSTTFPFTTTFQYTPPASSAGLRAAIIIIECQTYQADYPTKRYPINYIMSASKAHISGAYFGGGGSRGAALRRHRRGTGVARGQLDAQGRDLLAQPVSSVQRSSAHSRRSGGGQQQGKRHDAH